MLGLRRTKLDEFGIGLEDKLSLCVYKGGGKGGGGVETVVQSAPTPAPTPPIEDVSLQSAYSEDDKTKKKLREGKGSLKIPLATEVDTGLKV